MGLLIRRSLGVDIGPRRARAAQIALGRGGGRIERFAECALPVEEGARASALKDLIRGGGFRAGLPARLAVPGEAVFFHAIETDLHRLEDVRRVLPFETEGEFPFPPEELVMDICSARPVAEEQQHVLIAATRREALAAFLRVPAGAGIEVGGVDAAACALCASAARAEPATTAQPHLIVYLAEGQSLIAVAEGGRLLSARNLPHAGAEPLGSRAIEREMELCWREVFNAAIPPGTLCLTGGEPTLTGGLSDALASESGLSARALPPASDLAAEGATPGPEFALAVALALRSAGEGGAVNFLLADGAAAREARARSLALGVGAALLAGIFVVWAAGLALKWSALKARERTIRAETDRLLREVFPGASGGDLPQDALARVESRLAEERREHAAFNFLGCHATTPLKVLHLVSDRLPPGLRVKVTALEINEQNVRLAGTVDSYEAIDKLRAHLQSAPEFAEVVVREESADRNAQTVRFSAAFSVRGR